MGTLYFSETETHNFNNEKNKCESKKCPLNNNLDVVNTKKENHSQSTPGPNQTQPGKCQCGTVSLIVAGLILLTLGFLSIKYALTDIILTERLKMHSENANEFLNGRDSKIKITEIGPIAYREYLQHRDVVFHENSTLSYTAFRWAEFVPHANRPGILNETITVPNFAILAAASFVNTHNYFVQLGYNYLHRKYNDGLFINISIYDYLWNYKSKLLKKAQEFAPTMVPTLNSGILHGMYANNADRYNVKIGTKYGNSQFFQINTVNGATTVPGYDVKKGDCNASVQNSTEGAMYRQRLTKNSVLTFWRKALCRTVDLHFEKELKVEDILTYKYTLGPETYDRKLNNETDCYKGVYQELPNGLTDVSKCYFDLPFAASLPHFYGRSEGITKKFEGLNAKEENHSCFTIVEPKMGVPFSQAARSQMNVVIPKLSSFFENDYQLFSDMILPMFWVEFFQKDLTPEILSMVGFFANVLPVIEVTLTCTFLFVGFALLLTAVVQLSYSRWNDLTKTYRLNFKFAQRSNCDSLK